jgi:acetyl esterase/lipase
MAAASLERKRRILLIWRSLGAAILFGAFVAGEILDPATAMAADPALRPAPPACASAPPQPETVPGAVSIVYKTASGRDLRMHLFTPGAEKGGRPAALFFFGGDWRTGDVRAFLGQAEALADLGYVAALADYRVRCRDGTSPLDALEDAQAAFEWLRKASGELGADPERIVLVGASAGGQLALATAMLATPEHKPAALVLFNPAVNLVALAPLLGLDPAAAARVSPSALPVSALPPTLVLQGGADGAIPIRDVEAFCDRARTAGRVCRVDAYPGEDHGFFDRREPRSPLGRPAYADTLAKLLDFLNSLGLTGRPEG